MKSVCPPSLLGAVAVLLAFSAPAYAQVRITEVAAWGSGNAPYATDWFELTNTGASAVSVSGWQMDDGSAGSAKVALTGIGSIAAGESVIFTENAATASFLSSWFGASVPAGIQVGNYTGGGVGLSTSGDAVYVFDAGGALQAQVSFGASGGVAPFRTFDNTAGLDGAAIGQLSVAGVNTAFLAADGLEVGSPGSVGAVPEPSVYALMLAGLACVGAVARKRTR